MDFEPQKWIPPRDMGLVGTYARNEKLRDAALWDTGGMGPEDVAIDQEGRIVTGIADGRILRFSPEGGPPQEIGQTGGRPLGIEVHPDGDGFIVCDADRGLLHLLPNGEIIALATEHNGLRFTITNNASVAADGTIYFSVSSHRWPFSDYVTDLVERSATGRLYRRDPNGDIDVLLDGMVFANGVALSPDGDYVLVAETGSYRINRVWLSGARAGRPDVFVDNLPGFPDNLSEAHGRFWCAFYAPRNKMLDVTGTRPWMRTVLDRLPETVMPKPARHGFVAAYDADGTVVANLQDPTGRVAATTGVRAVGRLLYVGSLSEPHVAVVALPAFFE
jgi:sugar lactone lactonase YvrE